jgi:hypothetical protein
MRLRNSFWAMLQPERSPAQVAPLEEIRQVMLDVIERHCGKDQLNIEAEIAFASDLAALWYLRPKLMQALSTTVAQKIAERELRNITALFVGHYSGV